MTSSSNETLERIARRIPIPEPAYERLLRRRDRRVRNQRIAMRERRRVARAAMVAQDLLKGHYHRYTLGFRSAFKDIAL